MVPVDLPKGSGGEGYYPYSALLDLGATYNFITQAMADRLDLEAAKAGKRKKQWKLPPPTTTVNSEPLCACKGLAVWVRN
jgi:hypothetical protein